MKRSFLKVLASLLFVAIVANTLLPQFVTLGFSLNRQFASLQGFLVLLFIMVCKLLRDFDKFGGIAIYPSRLKHFSLKQLLFVVTVLGCVLGMAQFWPQLAAATGGAFVCRILQPYRSFHNAIADSLFWGTLATLMLRVVLRSTSDSITGIGELCLSIVFGALIGGSLAFPVQVTSSPSD